MLLPSCIPTKAWRNLIVSIDWWSTSSWWSHWQCDEHDEDGDKDKDDDDGVEYENYVDEDFRFFADSVEYVNLIITITIIIIMITIQVVVCKGKGVQLEMLSSRNTSPSSPSYSWVIFSSSSLKPPIIMMIIMIMMMTRLPERGFGEHQLEGAAESKHHGCIFIIVIIMKKWKSCWWSS